MILDEAAKQIQQLLLETFQKERYGRPALSEHEFNQLALDIFRFQFRHNEFYQKYCRNQNVIPGEIDDWRAIPALPTLAFKEAEIASFPVREAKLIFHTSGTTQGKPGRHFLPDDTLYRAAALRWFEENVVPDLVGDGKVSRMRCFILFPAAELLRHSSLAHMFEMIVRRWSLSADSSRPLDHDCYMDRDGLQLERCLENLNAACTEEIPVFIAGTAYSFVFLLDALHDRGQRFRLPPGSRLMDTGGFKGRTREVRRSELLEHYREFFGLSEEYVVNEYGMTELSSQFYDQRTGRHSDVRVLRGPSWTRCMAVDAETLEPLPSGVQGLIRIVDLANLWSVAAIQTEDIGTVKDDGLILSGRAEGAQLRGCSLTVEELLT